MMSMTGEQVLLRTYLDHADRSPFLPTFERIVKAARRERLAGATVLKGIMGVSPRRLLKPAFWSLADHVPVVVEVVDIPERILSFVYGPLNDHMIGGMATLERANVAMYRHRSHDQPNKFEPAKALKPLSTLPHVEPRGHMTINEAGVLLRVFIGESDRFEDKRLFEAIVHKVRELGLAGATVLRGIEGFGANSVIHRPAMFEYSTDAPIVVEVVDTEDKIKLLLPHLEVMVNEGMITMEYVVILLYGHAAEDGPKRPDRTPDGPPVA
jgi:PII-like signaling protein